MNYFNKNLKKNIAVIIVGIIMLIVVIISQPPSDFPEKRFSIHVEKSESIGSVAHDLYIKKVIRSELLFKLSSVFISLNKGIQAGDYRFNYPENNIVIAYRMIKGYQRQNKVSVTIPEGTNVNDMAFILLKALPDFNAPLFVSIAKKSEGYLYPDTYYFLENAQPDEVIRTMRANFDSKIATIQKDILAFGKPLSEIVTMASLVEKETYADESRRIVAGILWRRIDEGMPLQVDAPFYYITGKAGNFTFDDLKIKSPYNTYINKGLPIGPISNPSIDTIKDTINPIKTNYVFYLTGSDGTMRYADTFAKHVENRNKYLR